MALTLSQLVDGIRKYEARLTGSDHDKTAFARNIALLSGRVVAVETTLRAAAAALDAPDFSDYFKGASEDDSAYLIGGSPDNPNGVSFSPSAAQRWWEVVFRDRLNISRVRPTLLPGSLVLSPEGVAEASALGVSSTDYAPEDFNPLGLPVIA